MTDEMTKGLDLESIEDAYPVGCHACGDTVETCDGLYYDHGACDVSGKPVPEGVERRAPSTVKALVAEVRRLREDGSDPASDVERLAAVRELVDAEWRRDMDDLRAQMERVRHEAAKDYDESARLRTDNARLDDVARGALDDLARVRAELDATREALRAHLFCDECEELATRCHAASANFGCDAHGIGDGWRDTTHAAAIRAAGGVR